MKNNTSIYAWTMLISLIVVVTVTFIICLAEVSKTVSYLLFAVDIVAAIVFTVCPYGSQEHLQGDNDKS